MDIEKISIISGSALLALTVTASAGPMSVSSSQIVTPPMPIEQAHYYHRHHYRHHGWHYGWWYPHRGHAWRYGWHRGWYPHRYDYAYGFGYPYYYGYWPGLAAATAAPLMMGRSVATGAGYGYNAYCAYGYDYPYGCYYTPGAETKPLITGRSVAASGNYCVTPVKTCLLKEPGWMGTGCSCKVEGGRARGTVE